MKSLNWSVIFYIFSVFSDELRKATADKVITVDEAIVIFKEVVDKLGLGDEALLKI